MRVFLIVPNSMGGLMYKPAYPHVGISYLAGMLQQQRHAVAVLDMNLHPSSKALDKALAEFAPDLVGLTIASYDRERTYQLVGHIKDKGYRVVIGGPHVSIARGQVLAESRADLAVSREGEYTLAELCAGTDYRDIKGLSWRNGDAVQDNEERELISDLDDLPFPPYDLFALAEYVDRKIPILTSRGCPGGCIFCSIGLTMGKGFRARSPNNVIAEIEHWYRRGYRWFVFPDDCFSFNMDRAKEICRLILERGLKIKWELRNGLRADRVDAELLRLMKEAGLFFVSYGVESANDEVLHNVRKGVSVAEVRQAVEMTHAAGIDVCGFFMVGLPGDTYQRSAASLEFAQSLPLTEAWFYNTIPYPGTELFDWVNANARWVQSPEEYLGRLQHHDSRPVFETDDFSRKERRRAFVRAEAWAMKKNLAKEFGSLWGRVAWLLWRYPSVRRIAAMPGKVLWQLMRRRRFGR